MANSVPYQAGMTLGRTFDVRENRSGMDIFGRESTSNPRSIDSTNTSITYKVIKSSEDVKTFFNISGDVSLRIKAGLLKVEGMWALLRDDKSDENSLDIFAKAQVETVTETLTSSQPTQDWRRNNIGTHYVRSITYGGELFVRISIRGSDSEKKKEIQEKVEANINLSGISAIEAKQFLKKMEEELRNSSEINISYYRTGYAESLPKDIDSMFKALEEFPNQMKQINNGKGYPLRCELVPLNQLDSDVSEFAQQRVSSHRLKQLEDQYDDIRIAKNILETFLAHDDLTLTDEQRKETKDIEKRVDDMHDRFLDVISDIDVTSGKECDDKIKTASDLYREHKPQGGFRSEVRRFISKVEPTKNQTLEELPPGPPLNIVLLGKTGHGKSATGNSIFGAEKFKSLTSSSSVTHRCKLERGKVGGREINLVDTPGTMDTKNFKLSMDEFGTAIAFCPDGYHAFLLTLRIDVRMTDEEWMAIHLLKKMFGRHILDYSIIVFTHGDHFLNDKTRKEKTLHEYIQNQNNGLTKLVNDCDSRCCIINNWEKDSGIRRKQVIEIITLIDKVRDHNDCKMYTNDLFEFAQVELRKEQEKHAEKQRWIEKKQRKEKDKLKRDEGSKPKEEVAKAENKLQEKFKSYEDELQKEKEELEEKVGQKVAQKALDSDRGCFPPDALIRLQDGRLIQLADLHVGDKILCFASHGKMEYSEVYFFAHLDPNSSNQYITISTSNHKLKLTPDHHVYIVDIGGYLNTVPARKMKVGDRILVLDEDTPSLKEEIVTNVSAPIIEVGIFAPITISGTIIVNNVLASCYVDIVPPKLSHPLLWPLRKLYRMTPPLSARINSIGKGGIPSWSKFIMNKFLRWRK